MTTIHRLSFLFLLVFLVGCLKEDTSTVEDFITTGLKPIYSDGNFQSFDVREAQPIQNLGKIYYKDPYIYVIERSKGIHILDNSNPSNPIAVKFIQIPACADIAIKGNILYANNFTDLLSIDIADFDNITLLNRVENIYPKPKNYPEGYRGHFECVDPNKGILLRWETAELTNPKCRR